MLVLNQFERETASIDFPPRIGTSAVLPGEVERALRSTGYHGLCAVDIFVHSGVVVLRGNVPTYHMKQVAQTVALVLPGVRMVRNELNVDRSQYLRTPATSALFATPKADI